VATKLLNIILRQRVSGCNICSGGKMRGELNSPVEVLRRLAYLLYVLIFLVYILSCVIVLARPGIAEVGVSVGSFLALLLIRQAGYRWLDFQRLSESFPTGCALDRIPEPVRTEVEDLVAEFHSAETEWPRRAEIRHRLIELEEQQPEIIPAFESELKKVLAA